MLEVPENDTEGYVAYYDDDDEDDDAEPRFVAIWKTKKLIDRCNNRFHQDDAYRLMCQGYPFFVSRKSTSTGKFFSPIFTTLSFHEDSAAWGQIYKFVQRLSVVTEITISTTTTI